MTWSLWRRVRFFGGAGILAAAIAVAMQLLFADIPNERAFNQYSPTGGSPLWPSVRLIAIWLSTSGLAIGVLLPLYRHPRGGIAVGLAVYALLFLSASIANDRLWTLPDDGVELAQLVVFIVGAMLITVTLGMEGRALALGEPDDGSSEIPPVA